MTKNFTNEEMKHKDFSLELSVSEKFLLVMINLILFILLSLLFPLFLMLSFNVNML